MGRKGGIEVENLVREFRKGPRAVDGISLRVGPGEVYGFLGPNGAGKSTTVLMLTTLLPPTSGTARVAGYDIVEEGPQVRASIGAALQEAALDQFLTGRDHLRLQGVVFLLVGTLMGVDVRSGFFGMVVIVFLTVLVALGFGGIGAILALRTGSVEAVESAFPLFFVAIFMSSINLPRDLIEADWFRFIATINPISYLVEGIRSLVITGWDAQALTLGFGCAAAIVALALAGAAASLKTRVA
jgi:hypothetical protein